MSKTERRSFFYLPASGKELYTKLNRYDADVFVFDLEDGVKEDSKNYARKVLLETKKPKYLKKKEFFVRINGIRTPHCYKDLETVFSLDLIPDAVALPKIESAKDIEKLETILEHYENIKGLPNQIEISACIETLRGEKNAEEILTSSKRIKTVQCGENGDYTASYGSDFPLDVRRDPIASDFIFKILKLTRLYGISFIDGAYFKTAENKENAEELEERCKYMRMFGAKGKLVIHPSQIRIVNEVFSLSPEEIKEKEEFIKKYEQHLKNRTPSAYLRKGDTLIGPTQYKAAKE